MKESFTYLIIKNFKSRAVISIFILWTVSLAVLIAVGIGYRANMELRSFRFYQDRFLARYLIWNGFIDALNILRQDDLSVDSFQDEWNSSHKIDSVEGSCFFTIKDEDEKIDINRASLRVLKYFFPQGDLAESILDWIDKDDVPDFRENKYYKLLGYQCRNSDIRSLYEIKYIKGGKDSDIIDVANYFTVYSDGRLNLNTANRECLAALGIIPSLQDKVISFRNSGLVFRNISEPVSILALTKPEKDNWMDKRKYFKVRSSYFRIFLEAETKRGIKSYALAVVEREASKFKIVFWRENFWKE